MGLQNLNGMGSRNCSIHTCVSMGLTLSGMTYPLWNDLPTNLRNIDSLASFKTKLKTHLLIKYYKT